MKRNVEDNPIPQPLIVTATMNVIGGKACMK